MKQKQPEPGWKCRCAQGSQTDLLIMSLKGFSECKGFHRGQRWLGTQHTICIFKVRNKKVSNKKKNLFNSCFNPEYVNVIDQEILFFCNS